MNLPIIFRFLPAEFSDIKYPDYKQSGLNPPLLSTAGQCYRQFASKLIMAIERLYKEMASLPDSPVEDGQRTIRTILVVDEAHNYLSQKNIFLQRIIREGRSKGIVAFFAANQKSRRKSCKLRGWKTKE